MKYYCRVLPRDAFNESSLLKCIGKLTLLIEDRCAPDWTYTYDSEPFEIDQNQDDGSLSVVNVEFKFKGQRVRLFRPLNAREAWPLWAVLDDQEFEVFTPDGNLVTHEPSTEEKMLQAQQHAVKLVEKAMEKWDEIEKRA